MLRVATHVGLSQKQPKKKKNLTSCKLKLQTTQNKAKKIKTRIKNNIKQLRRLKKSLTKKKQKCLECERTNLKV
jgi:predicted phage-related endonuclease